MNKIFNFTSKHSSNEPKNTDASSQNNASARFSVALNSAYEKLSSAYASASKTLSSQYQSTPSIFPASGDSVKHARNQEKGQPKLQNAMAVIKNGIAKDLEKVDTQTILELNAKLKNPATQDSAYKSLMKDEHTKRLENVTKFTSSFFAKAGKEVARENNAKSNMVNVQNAVVEALENKIGNTSSAKNEYVFKEIQNLKQCANNSLFTIELLQGVLQKAKDLRDTPAPFIEDAVKRGTVSPEGKNEDLRNLYLLNDIVSELESKIGEMKFNKIKGQYNDLVQSLKNSTSSSKTRSIMAEINALLAELEGLKIPDLSMPTSSWGFNFFGMPMLTIPDLKSAFKKLFSEAEDLLEIQVANEDVAQTEQEMNSFRTDLETLAQEGANGKGLDLSALRSLLDRIKKLMNSNSAAAGSPNNHAELKRVEEATQTAISKGEETNRQNAVKQEVAAIDQTINAIKKKTNEKLGKLNTLIKTFEQPVTAERLKGEIQVTNWRQGFGQDLYEYLATVNTDSTFSHDEMPSSDEKLKQRLDYEKDCFVLTIRQKAQEKIDSLTKKLEEKAKQIPGSGVWGHVFSSFTETEKFLASAHRSLKKNQDVIFTLSKKVAAFEAKNKDVKLKFSQEEIEAKRVEAIQATNAKRLAELSKTQAVQQTRLEKLQAQKKAFEAELNALLAELGKSTFGSMFSGPSWKIQGLKTQIANYKNAISAINTSPEFQEYSKLLVAGQPRASLIPNDSEIESIDRDVLVFDADVVETNETAEEVVMKEEEERNHLLGLRQMDWI